MPDEIAEKIPLEAIQSSNLLGIGFNAQKQLLAVQFKGGHIYHYAGVSVEDAAALYGAESRGRHYAQHIKGKFSGQKMTGKCPSCADGPGWIGETCTDCGTATYADQPREDKA